MCILYGTLCVGIGSLRLTGNSNGLKDQQFVLNFTSSTWLSSQRPAIPSLTSSVSELPSVFGELVAVKYPLQERI